MQRTDSPLFSPVSYHRRYLEVFDETALPKQTRYIKVRDFKQALKVLQQMRTRAYGQVLLFYYLVILDARKNKVNTLKNFKKRLKFLCTEFSRMRPTFGFAQFREHIESLLKGLKKEDWLSVLESRILEYIDSINRLRRNRAKILAKLLPQHPAIMTICNVSGELVALAQELSRQGRRIQFFVSETRPYLQGARLTAWELQRAGFRVNLFCDIQAANIMLKNNISAVVTGSDRCSQDGDIINKIGTYSLAVLAKHFHIPFYCLVQPPAKTKEIKDVQIEFRPGEELRKFANQFILSPKQKVLYPAFDIVPKDYISKLIFFDGAFSPQEFKKKWRA